LPLLGERETGKEAKSLLQKGLMGFNDRIANQVPRLQNDAEA